METKIISEKEKKEIIALAENAKQYCDLLIEQCDSWLPENNHSIPLHRESSIFIKLYNHLKISKK